MTVFLLDALVASLLLMAITFCWQLHKRLFEIKTKTYLDPFTVPGLQLSKDLETLIRQGQKTTQQLSEAIEEAARIETSKHAESTRYHPTLF